MEELSPNYWNTLASQLIVISTLLGGFSFANLFVVHGIDCQPKLKRNLFKGLTLSSVGFIVSIFAMTNIIMRTTDGYPFPISNKTLLLPRIVGVISLLVGLISIIYVITISGKLKEYNTRTFSLIVGLIALILIILML